MSTPDRLTDEERDDEAGPAHAVGLRDAYTEGDVAHLLNPVIGWLRLALHDGTPFTITDVRSMVARLSWAVRSEERLAARLAAQHPDTVRLREVTSLLGYGDGITEPQADQPTLLAHLDVLMGEAAEWREHEQWRYVCAEAGHPDDEDCYEHDPHLAAHGDLAARPAPDTLADRLQAQAKADALRSQRDFFLSVDMPAAADHCEEAAVEWESARDDADRALLAGRSDASPKGAPEQQPATPTTTAGQPVDLLAALQESVNRAKQKPASPGGGA